MAHQRINPHDGKLPKSVERMSSARLDEVLAAAEDRFRTWKHKSCVDRAAILRRAAALLYSHADDFARLETLEMGKRIAEARAEVGFSGDILGYYAEHAESFLAPMTFQATRSRVGVVGTWSRIGIQDLVDQKPVRSGGIAEPAWFIAGFGPESAAGKRVAPGADRPEVTA